jgi:glutaredoxin
MMNGGFLRSIARSFVARLSLILALMSTCGLAGLSLAAVVQAPARNAAHEAATRPADVEVFLREGCPHCAKAKEFLEGLARERPELRIVFRDVRRDPSALSRLREITEAQGSVSVPTFDVHGHIIVGYSDEATTGKLILNALSESRLHSRQSGQSAGSCEAEESLSCEAGAPEPESFEIMLLGHRVALETVGLPLFTVSMGLLDGFNPCSMWVLILMISLLAPMKNRMRMFAVAGAFVAVEGVAYLAFMAAWLNLFLLIGLSRASEIIIAAIAILAGAINLKDFWAYGWGVSLSIPEAAKPGIYARARGILQAENLRGAMIGAVALAVLVQIVEFLCTSGFPALYTRILTLRQLSGFSYYGYLLLYNAAYMLDDLIVLAIGIITLSQRRLQEKEGRWLKLISGVVMVGLGIYLIIPRQ